MLTRMTDNVWNQDQGNIDEEDDDNDDDGEGGVPPALFIDRNGERFQYILDFRRDNEVHLPVTVSKATFGKDLEYFGFFLPEEGSHSGIIIVVVLLLLLPAIPFSRSVWLKCLRLR